MILYNIGIYMWEGNHKNEEKLRNAKCLSSQKRIHDTSWSDCIELLVIIIL